jgi:serine phosphatase RsbU (regulator of sigma subunit)
MDKVMPEYFVLFKPRDIVSGDFYWIKEVYNYLIIVVADCTGHGVPGAFMSMLGISLLNEEVGKSGFDKPGKILNGLRKKVKETLAQEGKDHEQQEGMEMALAIIDNNSKELQYAGANNSLYLIREKKQLHGDHLRMYASLDNKYYQLFELKGDKQPVAFYLEETDFTTKQIQLQEGDSIYLFTDGYVDQKGGPKSRKFLSKNLKKSLLEIQPNTMEVQHMILNDTLENWKKGFEQIDDILVMGIRI